jgi:hypothetical protein
LSRRMAQTVRKLAGFSKSRSPLRPIYGHEQMRLERPEPPVLPLRCRCESKAAITGDWGFPAGLHEPAPASPRGPPGPDRLSARPCRSTACPRPTDSPQSSEPR